jgi:hypothetical protein
MSAYYAGMHRDERTPGNRLYGMMKALLTQFAQRRVPEPAAPRGVVEEQDALDAVMSLAGFLDAGAQAGQLSRNDAEHMASMLMVVREYVRPLPVGRVETDGGAVDGVTPDLQQMVDGLRLVRERDGYRG